MGADRRSKRVKRSAISKEQLEPIAPKKPPIKLYHGKEVHTMTDQERLSLKDFIDRMIYLSFQMKATQSFAPIQILSEPDRPHILLARKDEFDEIRKLYEIDDADVKITATEIAIHYTFRINNVFMVSFIDLKEPYETIK